MPSRIRRFATVAAAAAIAMAIAACDSTPTTTAGQSSAAPSVSTVPATPRASKKPVPTASAPSSPTAAASVPPAPAEGTATPVSPASMCTGSADIQAFWAGAAKGLKFDVYCAVLPKGWSVTGGTWEGKGGGKLNFAYKGPRGAKLVLNEGAFCTTGLSACEPHDQDLGVANFGDRPGGLFSLGPDAGFAIYVNPGAAPSWSITGTGLTRDAFTSLAAALEKVPKS